MARHQASRKYQLTFNNPLEHGFSHPQIKAILSDLASTAYWCMCDEVGAGEHTPHTHLYIVFRNAVEFPNLKKHFYEAHIEMVNGSNQQNRDYIRKEGKWADSDKAETNLPDTFEESGEMPADRSASQKQSDEILALVKQGASNAEIMEQYPSSMNRLDKIEKARQTILNEKYKEVFRKLTVTYLWGETGVGKTRSIMEQFCYSNVYRVTNYKNPFDGYEGQDVIIFEEFRSSLPISDMLVYLDGYPTKLPCRFNDKQACFTKVFIITNIPIEKQYPNIQIDEPETWQAFLRRINYNEKKQTGAKNQQFLPVLEWMPDPFEEIGGAVDVQ